MGTYRRFFLSKTDKEPFDIISSGSFENPIISPFVIKDSQKYISNTHKLYIIGIDIYTDNLIIQKNGGNPSVLVEFSLDGTNFTQDKLIVGEVDAIGKTIVIPIWIRFSIFDDKSKYVLNSIVNINDIKIGLYY